MATDAAAQSDVCFGDDRDIYCASSDGTQRTRLLDGGRSYTLALDGQHGYVYQVDDVRQLFRMRLDGSERALIGSFENRPVDMAVDPAHGYVYYAFAGDSQVGPVIARSDLDGGGLEVLPLQLRYPAGIAVDPDY